MFICFFFFFKVYLGLVFSKSWFIKHTAWKCLEYFGDFMADQEMGAKLSRGLSRVWWVWYLMSVIWGERERLLFTAMCSGSRSGILSFNRFTLNYCLWGTEQPLPIKLSKACPLQGQCFKGPWDICAQTCVRMGVSASLTCPCPHVVTEYTVGVCVCVCQSYNHLTI